MKKLVVSLMLLFCVVAGVFGEPKEILRKYFDDEILMVFDESDEETEYIRVSVIDLNEPNQIKHIYSFNKQKSLELAYKLMENLYRKSMTKQIDEMEEKNELIIVKEPNYEIFGDAFTKVTYYFLET